MSNSLVSLRHRNFRLIWLGLLASFTGSFMQNAALLWHVSLLVPPERRQRVSVADVIGPEATRQVIEEEREFRKGTQLVGPQVHRRTRADDMLTPGEAAKLQAEIGRTLAIGAKVRFAHAMRRRRR